MSGLLDFLQSASNSVASNVTAPVDGIAWLLRKAGIPVPDAPVGGSDWAQNAGLTRPVQQSGASLAGESLGMIAPMLIAAKAPQVARGLLQAGENAMVPRTLNPQTGAIVWHGSPVRQPFVYPQDKALATAQRNAALPIEQGGLGLGAENTAMERARALGFDGGYWHETNPTTAETIKSFSVDPSLAKAAASDELTPYSVFLKKHGGTINVTKDPVQMPLMVNKGRELQYADRDAFQRSLEASGPKADEIRDAIAETGLYDREMGRKFDSMFSDRGRGYDPTEAEQFLANWEAKNASNAAEAKKLITDRLNSGSSYFGADTVRLLNDSGSFGRKVDTTMVMNPANIRSRFAAFDPMRRNEADLLGRADPELLGLLSAGLLGYGGYNALSKP